MIDIEQADEIRLPDAIDHFPPDMISHLIKMHRFDHTNDEYKKKQARGKINVKFL